MSEARKRDTLIETLEKLIGAYVTVHSIRYMIGRFEQIEVGGVPLQPTIPPTVPELPPSSPYPTLPPSQPPQSGEYASMVIGIMAKEYYVDSYVYTDSHVIICIGSQCYTARHGDTIYVYRGFSMRFEAPNEYYYRPLTGSFDVFHRILYERTKLKILGQYIDILETYNNSFDYTFDYIDTRGYELIAFYRMVNAWVVDNIGYSVNDEYVPVFCANVRNFLYGYDAPVYYRNQFIGKFSEICT